MINSKFATKEVIVINQQIDANGSSDKQSVVKGISCIKTFFIYISEVSMDSQENLKGKNLELSQGHIMLKVIAKIK